MRTRRVFTAEERAVMRRACRHRWGAWNRLWSRPDVERRACRVCMDYEQREVSNAGS